MSLRGVDIASYQAGMNCAKTDAEFFIIKATQGTSYSNPYFEKHYAQAAAAGKLTGAYHYASGGDPVKEADFFMGVVGSRVGGCILALDWEHNPGGGENPVFNTSKEVSWCLSFAERIHAKKGVWPLMYMSASVTRRRDWSAVAKHCPLWMAQYGSTRITGYQTDPWTDGKQLGAWKRSIAIHQYSPSGSISGYRCNKQHGLDLDIAYLTKEEWQAYAKGDAAQASEKQQILFPEMTDTDLAVEVLFDLHGSSEARRKALGNRYTSVQGVVDELFGDFAAFVAATRHYVSEHGADRLKRA